MYVGKPLLRNRKVAYVLFTFMGFGTLARVTTFDIAGYFLLHFGPKVISTSPPFSLRLAWMINLVICLQYLTSECFRQKRPRDSSGDLTEDTDSIKKNFLE